MSLHARFIANHPLANVSFAVILLLGVLGYLNMLNMPREQDPEINFNWLVVNTVLPGASAEDVEKEVTDPLEEAIRTLPDIRFVSSTSRDNSSIILVRFRDVSERQFDKHVTDLRRLVRNKYNSDLPDDAREPDVQEITTSNGFPTAMVLLTGPANDERLRRTARQIKDDIERLPGVDRVLATGQGDPEPRVEFSPAEAAARGPNAAQIADAVRETAKVEAVVRRHLNDAAPRGVTSHAGVKWTDTEPLYGESYGQVSVSLNPRANGMREVTQVVEAMRAEIEALPSRGTISFTQLSGGPPAAKAIKLRLRGDDVSELRTAAQELKQAVIQIDGTRDVTDDDLPGRPQLVLQLDAEALKSAGLDPATVARLVRLHTEGEIVAEMRDSGDKGDKIEVRVRGATSNQGGANQSGANPDSLADIQQLLADPVALPGGGTTTLGALVHADTRIGSGGIKHYNLKRAITIESDLDKTRIDTVEANARIAAQWDAMEARYPNTRIDFSGELDDINESLDAMKMLFLFGVGLIYLILAAQFRSYWQPQLILLTVPMAFTGVVFGLFITQNPLSLYTPYGVIAVTGIAVNSAIVLIDAANARLAAGMGLLHATLYAARRRVVPIIITTTTTIGGLFSLAVGLGGKSLIWGPMAASLVWGLLVATTLTLFTMPILFRLAMQIGPVLRGGASRRLRRAPAA